MSLSQLQQRIADALPPIDVRRAGPGTRSKNPKRYDANKHLGKAAKAAAAKQSS